jgi:hypothetical protein
VYDNVKSCLFACASCHGCKIYDWVLWLMSLSASRYRRFDPMEDEKRDAADACIFEIGGNRGIVGHVVARLHVVGDRSWRAGLL